MLGSSFEDVEERRHVGVDAATEILQVNEDRIERPHRLAGRTPDLAVEAEHRNAVGRIGVVGQLHHIVLEIAANTVLRTEYGGDFQSRREERVEAVGQVLRHGRRVPKQGDALAFERAANLRFGEKPVNSEQGHESCLRKACGEATGVMKIGLLARMGERPVGLGPVLLFQTEESPSSQLVSAEAMVAPSVHQVRLSSMRI